MVTESLQKIVVRAVHFPLLALLFNACSTSIANYRGNYNIDHSSFIADGQIRLKTQMAPTKS
jgi:hypothetical protein